jgi:hypothetical protein
MWQSVVPPASPSTHRPGPRSPSPSFSLCCPSLLSESEGIVAGASPRRDSGGDDGGGAGTVRAVAPDGGDIRTPLQCQAVN